MGIPDSMRASRMILRKALGNILFDGDIVLDPQRVPVNLSPTGVHKVKRKQCKQFASDDQRLEESVGVSGRERRGSRAPRRSKRLREKSLGEVSHSVFDGDIVPSNQQNEKTDIQYVPKLVVIPNYPPMYTKYNPGEGNCFFYGLQLGLEKLGLNEE